MELTCLACDHRINGTIAIDSLGWHSSCPHFRGFDYPLICRQAGAREVAK